MYQGAPSKEMAIESLVHKWKMKMDFKCYQTINEESPDIFGVFFDGGYAFGYLTDMDLEFALKEKSKVDV